MRKINVAIIGAGSAQFSAGIVRDLCVSPVLEGAHVNLMDIDEKRLDMIERFAKKIVSELGRDITFTKTLDRGHALENSDFVINTVQWGGHSYPLEMNKVAAKHGYYREGSLVNASQLIFHLGLARDVERICPDAWLIQSGNPVFEGCTLIHRETKAKILGLCHGHYGYKEVARKIGLDPEHVTAQMSGFNHWIFMTDFRYKGENAYPLLDEWIEKSGPDYWRDFKPRYGDTCLSYAACEQYRLFGLMPIGDTPRMLGWWYNDSLESKKRGYGHIGGFDSEEGWALYLEDLNANLKRIEEAVTDDAKRATDIYPPKQSAEQIVPIMESLVFDRERVFQVNIPNRGGIIKGFPEDLVIECPGIVNGSGIKGVMQPELPRRIFAGAMIVRWQRAESMVTAVANHDRNMLFLHLLENHKTRSFAQAEALFEDIWNHPLNGYMREWFH
jgi:alpha-galactosidase